MKRSKCAAKFIYLRMAPVLFSMLLLSNTLIQVHSIDTRSRSRKRRISLVTSIFVALSMPQPALVDDSAGNALSSSKLSLQRKYDEYSSTYNDLGGGSLASALGIDSMREAASRFVDGDVLEVALGTGLQSRYYNWKQIHSFIGVDLSPGMLEEANKNIPESVRASGVAEIQEMDAERLAFANERFDTAVDTFSMCVIPQPEKAIAEMSRVTRKGGKVVLLENSISTNGILARIQNIMEPIVTPLSKGCRWNVDVPKLAAKAGLELENYESIQAGTIMLGIYRKL